MARTRSSNSMAIAANVEPSKRSIASLQDRHKEVLMRAIAKVLSSPIAKTTYGQIIDGLPLADVVFDTYGSIVCPGHPLLDQHFGLSEDVVDKASQLYSDFDPVILKMDSAVLSAFQAAKPGSRAFKTRLIELVARSIHQIAIDLHQLGPIRPKSDPLLSWRPSGDIVPGYPSGFPPTLFRHPWYRYYDQYPEGIADGIGYWAEARILGGVVLFDRRDPVITKDADPDAIYFHSDNRNVIYRIYRLLDDQKQQPLEFLLSEVTPPPSCPLPIHGSAGNRHRVDPEEAIHETGIYRDLWERRPISEFDGDDRLRDVVDTFNYLSEDDWEDARDRGMQLRDRRLLESISGNT